MADTAANPDCTVCCPSVSVACCSGTSLSENLTATVTNVSGCSCLNAKVVALNWNGSIWSGSLAVSNCGTNHILTLAFSCPGGSNGCEDFVLTGTCGDGTGTLSASVSGGCTCDPLDVTFTTSFLDDGCCLTGSSVSIRVTV